MTHLFFQLWFPVIILKDVVIPEMNANLDSTKISATYNVRVFCLLGVHIFHGLLQGSVRS